MNIMEDITGHYGVKIDEEICILQNKQKVRAKFTMEGLRYYSPVTVSWYVSETLLHNVVTGKYEVVKDEGKNQ